MEGNFGKDQSRRIGISQSGLRNASEWNVKFGRQHPQKQNVLDKDEQGIVPADAQRRRAAQLQLQLDDQTGNLERVVLLNRDCVASVRRYRTRGYRAEGQFIVPAEQAKGLLPIDRKYPLGDQAPRTTAPSEPNLPPPDLMREVDEHLRTWKDCLSENALIRLRRAEDRIQLDEREATRGNLRTHSQRTRLGHKGSEVRIGPNDYHPVVCKVLQQGHTIEIPLNNPAQNSAGETPGPRSMGFDANALRQAG